MRRKKKATPEGGFQVVRYFYFSVFYQKSYWTMKRTERGAWNDAGSR